MAKATKKLDPCDEDCRYARTGVCSFGPRNSVSCYLDNPEFFQSIIGIQEDIVKGMHMNPTIKKILEHCEFGHGKCYMLSILSRKKNNGDLTHGTEIMRRKLIMSENDVEDAYKYLKSRAQLDPDHRYYMYVNVNPRNMKKALYIMIKKLLSMLNDYESDECMPNRLAKIGGLWYSCLENDKCRGKTRNFLVDVDVEDTDILEAVLASIPEDTYIRMYPTRNGYHIVTRPFDSRAFEKEWNKETASINKDGLLFLEAINFEV